MRCRFWPMISDPERPNWVEKWEFTISTKCGHSTCVKAHARAVSSKTSPNVIADEYSNESRQQVCPEFLICGAQETAMFLCFPFLSYNTTQKSDFFVIQRCFGNGVMEITRICQRTFEISESLPYQFMRILSEKL